MLARTLLTLLALPFLCAGQDAPEFGLFFRFDSRPSPVFLRTMKQEMTAIMPGFALRWVPKEDTAGRSKTYSRVIVVRFRGSCAVTPGIPDPDEDFSTGIVLGDTVTSDGRILPYSVIDCDRLLAFLRIGVRTEVGLESRFGRAGGRVLAHELYHVLLQTPEHGRRGLAKAVHTPAALLSQSLLFEEGELEKIALLYRYKAASLHPPLPGN